MIRHKTKMKSSYEETVKELPVELRIPHHVERSALSHLALHIINFILYQRQQIPEPVQLLEREYSERSNNDHKTSKQNSVKTRQQTLMRKRIQTFLDNLDKLKGSLYDAFDENDPIEINLVIGATPFSVKEIFCIDLSQFTTEYNHTAVSSRIVSICSRKLCTALLSKDEFFINSASLSNVHIFIKARKGVMMPGWQPWPQYKKQKNKIQLIIKLKPQEEVSIEDKENYDLGDQNCSTPKNSAKKSTPKSILSARKRLPLRELPNAENVVTPLKGRTSLDKSAGSCAKFCEGEARLTPIKGNISLPMCELNDSERGSKLLLSSCNVPSRRLAKSFSNSCAKSIWSDASDINVKDLDVTEFENTPCTYTDKHGDCQNASDAEISGCIINCSTTNTTNPPTLKEIASHKLQVLKKLKATLKSEKPKFLKIYSHDEDEINSSFDNLECVDMELESCNDSTIICGLNYDEPEKLTEHKPHLLARMKPNELTGSGFCRYDVRKMSGQVLHSSAEVKLKELGQNYASESAGQETHSLADLKPNKLTVYELPDENDLTEFARQETHSLIEIKNSNLDDHLSHKLDNSDPNKSARQKQHSLSENFLGELKEMKLNENNLTESAGRIKPNSFILKYVDESTKRKLNGFTEHGSDDLDENDLKQLAEKETNKFAEYKPNSTTENELNEDNSHELAEKANRPIDSLLTESELDELTGNKPYESFENRSKGLAEDEPNKVTENNSKFFKNQTIEQFQPLSLKCISKKKLGEISKLQDREKSIEPILETEDLSSSKADTCQIDLNQDIFREIPSTKTYDSFIFQNGENLNLSKQIDDGNIPSAKLSSHSACEISDGQRNSLSKSPNDKPRIIGLACDDVKSGNIDSAMKTSEKNDFIWFKSNIVIKGFKF